MRIAIRHLIPGKKFTLSDEPYVRTDWRVATLVSWDQNDFVDRVGQSHRSQSNILLFQSDW